MKVRTSLFCVIALAFALLPEPGSAADSSRWPEKPVRIVVASGPGSGDDFVTRLYASKLSELTKQQFIVDNRPGAGGVIGQTLVLKSQPDGYTWLLAGGSMAGARYVSLAATYDVLRDFTVPHELIHEEYEPVNGLPALL